MKKIICILIICCFAFTIFAIPSSAYTLTPLPSGLKTYYFIIYDRMSYDYILWTTGAIQWVSESGANFVVRSYGQYTNTTRIIYKINFDNADSPYYNSWTVTSSEANWLYTYTASYNMFQYDIVYTSNDLINYSVNPPTIFFGVVDNYSLSNIDKKSEIQGGEAVQFNFDASGIIGGLNSLQNSLNSSLNSLLLNVSENLQSIRDALYLTYEDVTYTIDELALTLVFGIDEMTDRIIDMNDNVFIQFQGLGNILSNNFQNLYNKLDVLPEEIADELDKLLNPNSDQLSGTFAQSIKSDIEDRLPITTQITSTFNGLQSANTDILIEKTVSIGSLQMPIRIDTSFFAPYKSYIRGGISALFYVMLIIQLWSMISGVFHIGVKSGTSAYMIDNGLVNTDHHSVPGGKKKGK